MSNMNKSFIIGIILFGFLPAVHSQSDDAPLFLYEMTWVDVQSYLEENDMVIIPLGSIEQHGKHLPTGTDYFAALELSKRISARTGVVVAPILMAGYSEYHTGFPGTISISQETLEQVVFESIESLIKHGFKRFMFCNAHGGNNIVQEKLIHRVNSNTAAYATSIGVGSPLWPTEGIDYFDWHAGRFETSLDLCLFPDLVQFDKAEMPVIQFPEELEEMKLLAEEQPELYRIWDGSMFLPVESGKGTAVHEISSNGVISFSDPRDATPEYGQPYVDSIVNSATELIKAWKLLD